MRVTLLTGGDEGYPAIHLEAPVVLVDGVGEHDPLSFLHQGEQCRLLSAVDVVAHEAAVDAVRTPLLAVHHQLSR